MAGPVFQLRANQLNTANIAAIDILLKRLSLLSDNTLNKKVFHFKKDKNGHYRQWKCIQRASSRHVRKFIEL